MPEIATTMEPYKWYPQRAGRVDLIVQRAKETGRFGDPVVRQEIAKLLTMSKAAEWTARRARAAQEQGRPQGPEGSLGKLASSYIARAAARIHTQLTGADALADGLTRIPHLAAPGTPPDIVLHNRDGSPVPIAPQKQEWARRLLMRIDGVEQVKGSKYIMLHAPRSALPAIAKLLPGSEAPTVIPLEGRGDRVAVHAVCRENVFWETLEQLKSAGASSVLVLPVEKMLA